jgi:transposase-like protein
MRCANCKSSKRQVKNGLNKSGSQKYLCHECGRVYTPEPKPNGYPDEVRLLAVRMYVEGNSYNAIARILQVNPQSVVNWVKHYTDKLPAAPVPSQPKIAELDELYTYIGKKKTKSTS